MFCPNCGANVPNNEMFCRNCGFKVGTPQQQFYNNQYDGQKQGGYQQNGYQYNNAMNNSIQPQLPMKWYNFLIYFALFAGGILNFFSGILMVTGAHYDGEAEFVYEFFEGLQTLDIIVGLAMLAIGIFQIYVRFRLAGFKIDAPKLVTVLYTASMAINLIYVIGLYIVLGEASEAIAVEDMISSYITGTFVNVAFLAANITYFKKRQHLFVNK